MGTSVQIQVIEGEAIEGEDPPSVFLYAHWDGDEVLDRLKSKFRDARDRWDDSPYLTRIIFDVMKDGDQGLTGFGISSDPQGARTLVVDVTTQQVRAGEHEWSFEDFASKAIEDLYWKCREPV